MTTVTRVIEHLLVDKLLTKQPAASRKADIGQGVFALSIFFVCIGFGFLIYGVHMTLSQVYAPQTAALMTSVVSFGFAIVVGLLAYTAMMYRRSRIKKYKQEVVHKVENIVASLDDQFGGTIRENPKMAILLASAAGFFLEDRIL